MIISEVNQSHLEFSMSILREYGDKIAPHIQEAILAQKVIVGMPPYEAYLAGGKFSFEVKADAAKWPNDADPYKVIEAQTMHPDASEMWFIFENSTQFPEKGIVKFMVYVSNGRVANIQETGA